MSVSTNLLPANTSGIETDTSGWTAGANTTLSKSTRFYLGSSSLGMTATAAGSVTATTSARVAVTAGVEYTAYAYFAGVAAVAGRSTTVRVDWYAAVSGGTAISSVTSAGVALPNATTWVTPPPILIATAPAGAQYASITVAASGLAAGATVATDSISFGPPNLVTSNLLSYNTSGAEVDVTGWRLYGTAVLTRDTVTSAEGWYALAASNSATSGTAKIGTDVATTVTPGTEYHASAYVYAPVTAGTHTVGIRWYIDGGSTVDITSTIPVEASTWIRCSVIGVAPPGAVSARVMLEYTTTSAGQIWRYDVVGFRPAPSVAGSLIGYNVSSMEADASGWHADSGCTISRSTDYAWDGVASLRIDGTGADAVVSMTSRAPVTPRQAYQIIPHIRHGASASDRFFTTSFNWYDAADVLIRTVPLRWTFLAGAGGWYAPVTSAVAPTNAASLGITFRLTALPAGDPAYLDSIELTQGGMAAIADPVPDTYGATIALQGLTLGGYAYWGLWRMADDGTMSDIRGSSGYLSKTPITGDSLVVEDYEAPLGAPVRYYLRVWTTTSYRAVISEPIVIPEPPPTEIVLKDPGLPARQTTAVVAKGGQPAWTRRARQGVNEVRGRARPIVISDVRTSREGTMTLVTETADDVASMWWLLETGNTILLQWPSLWGEADTYVQIGDVSATPVVEYAEYSDRTWTIPLIEVDRPIGGATGSAGRTWQTVSESHADWLDVLTTYGSWLDVYTGANGA